LPGAGKETTMLKVAIIGCGKIADAHASQIRRIDGCEIVGVCDREPLMAKQIYERFPVKRYFTEVEDLISQARPDVVHITTPPESHFDLAKLCLEGGCNVYVEKPFTLYADQAEQLIRIANTRGLKLTVGHNDQFSHAARRLRSLVQQGYLGERLIHMESHYGYDLGDPSYAKALLGDKHHWVRRLPGKLLQNVISHGIAKIAEFLKGDRPQVFAYGFPSTLLKGIGEDEIADELRVVIADQDGTTAYFTFSSQMRPSIHEFRMYGSKNGLMLDQDHEIVLQLRGQKYKSYAERFIPPVGMAKQYLDNLKRNVRLFLNMDFHMDSGMKYLIESFYRSIQEDAPLPISYREILLTARIMDSIFEQLNREALIGESETQTLVQKTALAAS
jgi:predicted dehydrogenase